LKWLANLGITTKCRDISKMKLKSSSEISKYKENQAC